ncbi:hypothetical protein GIY09_08770 [Aerococcaceae bacterium WS4759]|uniref:Uncharacterized protein n=1 Tax=Fundicoccus ignavus TaxID=2664442 RepID=A0A6I2GNB1_9LACT|nr:hypothetical protein [Fundicoccus ignavus]
MLVFNRNMRIPSLEALGKISAINQEAALAVADVTRCQRDPVEEAGLGQRKLESMQHYIVFILAGMALGMLLFTSVGASWRRGFVSVVDFLPGSRFAKVMVVILLASSVWLSLHYKGLEKLHFAKGEVYVDSVEVRVAIWEAIEKEKTMHGVTERLEYLEDLDFQLTAAIMGMKEDLEVFIKRITFDQED